MRKLLLILIVLALLVGACGGGGGDEGQEEPSPAAGGDAARGEELFKQTLIGSQPGCVTCHSLEPDQVLVGPSMAGVADRAGSRVSGQSAESYLRESISRPDAYTVDGFAAGVMPAALADELSNQQVDDLVAYLLTLD
jgi:mono/diheme cytochrome c family protein